MSDSTRFPTLLPYLRRGESRVRLDPVQSTQHPDETGGFQNPFRILMEGTSLSRLIEATWVTDAGSSIQEVFLVLQRDGYPWTGREAGRLFNPAVEAIWQRTFAFCSEEAPSDLLVLEEQLDANGELAPLQSLFYCKEQRSFFHPPCPRCGLPLALCRDDSLLTAAHLLPYSRSLRRDLYCPPCTQSEIGGVFYAFELGPHDPTCVKDRFALVSEFGRVPASVDDSSGFPCGRCGHRETCFGLPNAVASRVFPFSFYPFYCLLFRAMPVNAAEFHVMLSGGSLADVRGLLQEQGEMGRLKAIEQCGLLGPEREAFLFREDERFFLEIVYLKLCLLAEAVSVLRRGADAARSVDAQATREQLWVSIPQKSGYLPGLWSFGLRIADVFTPLVESASHALTGGRGALYSIGLTWFQTLLVNASQDAAKVNQALDDLLDRRLAKADPSGAPPPWDLAGPVFGAENVFWRLGRLPRDIGWSGFWEEALNLGWTLLVASHASTRDWSWAAFEWQIAALQEQLRQALFHSPTRTPAEEQQGVSPDDSRAIHAILTEILQAWRNRVEQDQTARAVAAPPPPAPGEPVSEEDTLPLGVQWRAEDQELIETVILTGGTSEKPERVEAPPASTASPSEDMLPETIILGPQAPVEKHPDRLHPARPVSAPDRGGMPSGRDAGLSGLDSGATPPSDERTSSEPTSQEGPASSDEDDILMETIILSPKKGPGTPEKKE